MKYALVFASIAILFGINPAKSHDFWADGSRVDAKTKQLCCGRNDCHQIDFSRVHATSGGYVLELKNAWAYDLRYPALNPPNYDPLVAYDRAQPTPDGDTWVCWWNSEVKCFFTPMMGSWNME